MGKRFLPAPPLLRPTSQSWPGSAYSLQRMRNMAVGGLRGVNGSCHHRTRSLDGELGGERTNGRRSNFVVNRRRPPEEEEDEAAAGDGTERSPAEVTFAGMFNAFLEPIELDRQPSSQLSCTSALFHQLSVAHFHAREQGTLGSLV